MGWQIETLSWGYLIHRAAYLSLNLHEPLSRVAGSHNQQQQKKNKAEDTEDNVGNIKIPGRIVLDLWRILKSEVWDIRDTHYG